MSKEGSFARFGVWPTARDSGEGPASSARDNAARISVRLKGFGKKSAANLRAAIEDSQGRNFDRVLFALGIRFVGSITARNLAQYFGDIDSLLKAGLEELSHVREVGSKIAVAIKAYLSLPENLSLISELRSLGVNFSYKSEKSSDALDGKTFLLTGTLANYSRKDMESLIQSHGGKLVSGVGPALDYLVVGEKPGSKLDKARKTTTVKIISEAELLALLNPQ